MANEKRLIDANALKDGLSNLEASGGHIYYRQGMDDVLHKFMPSFIDEQPTVDAVEVVHGRWHDVALRYTEVKEECSVCHGVVRAHGFRYCPNCGAKMDEERRKGE